MAYVISNNNWASGMDVAGFSDFGKDGAPGPYIILIIAYVLFFVMMKWTRFGRRIYAVGSNTEAARSRVSMWMYSDQCLHHHGILSRTSRCAFGFHLRIGTAQHAVW